MAKSKKRNTGDKMTEENKVTITDAVVDTPIVNVTGEEDEVVVGTDTDDNVINGGDSTTSTDNELVLGSSDKLPELETSQPDSEEGKVEAPSSEPMQMSDVLLKINTAIQEGRVEAYIDKVVPATAEELNAEVLPNDDLCSWDKGIDGQLKAALNTLNDVSSRDTVSIQNARYTIYNNLFNAITYAKTDVLAYEFIGKFLDALATKPHVISKDRALIGFLSMTKLSRPQANMYQTIWSALVNTAVPSTRKVNSQSINWKMMSTMSDYHKRGGILYNRLYGFYQRC